MQYRFGTPYDDYVFSRVTADPDESVTEGQGGFFAKPAAHLDPRLIDPATNKLRPIVRDYVLRCLYFFWSTRYASAESWSTVWIAGSALSLQWDELGADLDVLIGVNLTRFLEANPQYQGMDEDEVTSMLNDELKSQLDPSTANADFEPGTPPFEVTFYCNPGGGDIRAINPYAAYNVTTNEWTVEPVQIGADWDPRAYFPQEWVAAADTNVRTASRLIEDFNADSAVARTAPDEPSRLNALHQVHQTLSRASDLFKNLHTGRQQAFRTGGEGYFDFRNFVWQSHAHAGTLKALHDLSVLHRDARAAQQHELYGEALQGPQDLLRTASLVGSDWYRRKMS